MPRSKLWFALVVCSLAVFAAGCSAGSTRTVQTQSGRFDAYEMRGTGEYAEPGTYSEKMELVEIEEPTGNAYVWVRGERILATCPFRDLKKDQPVTVEEKQDGTWVVARESAK